MLTLITLLLAPTAADFDAAAKVELARPDVTMAVVNWERAFAVDPDPRYLLSMARALAARPTRCVEAAAAFARFDAACDGCALAADAKAARAAARCTGVVNTTPAEVNVDGTAARSPLRLWAGVHILAANGREVTWCVAPDVTADVSFDGSSPIQVDLAGDASARAFAHQEAGLDHARASRFCAAVHEFERAYAASAEPGFLYNKALAYSMWRGRCAEALQTFDRFLANCPGCPQAADARQRKGQIVAECTGTLDLRTEPANAQLVVAGQRGPAPMVVRVPPGRHRVVVSAPGYEALALDAPVDLGGQHRLTLTLVPTPAAAPPAPPPPPPVKGKPWKWIAFSVGATGFASAGFFTWRASLNLDEFDRTLALAESDQSTSYKSELLTNLDDFDRNQTIAYVGWGIGAAGLLTGAVLWALEDSSEAEKSAWRLLPTPNGLGVARAF